MNRQGVVDYAFLEQLNGKPGVIQPELDASLSLDVKLAWFSHQLEVLTTHPGEEAVGLLAHAVLPFEDSVTKECRVWLELKPFAKAFEGTDSPPDGDPVKVSLENMRIKAAAATEDYKAKLQAWIDQTDTELSTPGAVPVSVPGHTAAQVRLSEYRRLKARIETQRDMLKTMQEHAENLFGEGASNYLSPAIVLRRAVERIHP